MSLFQNLYFSVFVLSLIVLLDVLLKFKKPIVLKFFFLLLPISIGLISLINSTAAINFVYFVAILKTNLAVAILNIFSILYFPKFRKSVLFVTLFMLSFSMFLMLVNENILPRNPLTDMFRTISVDKDLNVTINQLVRSIRFFYLFFIAINVGYFWYVIYNKVNLNNVYYEKIRTWTSFLFLLSCIVVFMNIVIGFVSNRELWTNSLTIFIGFYLLILVLKRPAFLNTSGKKIAFGHRFNLEQEAEIEELDFLSLFQDQRYFTNKDASLEGLANQLKVSPQNLAQFINKKYNMSFSDLVNKNRVNYFFEIVQNPDYQNFTIDALAKEVGFSSRQHLNKPFKKFHGGNPSDLIESAMLPKS